MRRERCPTCNRTNYATRVNLLSGDTACTVCLCADTSLDTSNLDLAILTERGLSAALAERHERLGW